MKYSKVYFKRFIFAKFYWLEEYLIFISPDYLGSAKHTWE